MFGLDFGTTNSLAAVVRGGRAHSFIDSEGLPHPSVVWYRGNEVVVGREAKGHLADSPRGESDDCIASPKSRLGTGAPVVVGGLAMPASKVVAEILRFLRSHAEASRQRADVSLDRAVVAIPVGMSGSARAELRRAAHEAGFEVDQFIHEPLAALYGFLREEADHRQAIARLEGRQVVVFDWGGGTLDVTLCEIRSGALAQVQSAGDDSVGGDRFDERIADFARREHTQAHGLAEWPEERAGARGKLLARSERAKIELSDDDEARIFVPDLLPLQGRAANLEVRIERVQAEALCCDLVDRGLSVIDRVLDAAGIREHGVAFCLAVGGMAQMPAIKHRLLERFGAARLRVREHAERLIAEGAAWVAHDGVSLRMAKPIEILHAGQVYASIIDEDLQLPRGGSEFRTGPVGLYCVDPRDGIAKLQFSRPRRPGRPRPSDVRDVYATLMLPVDSTARPMAERIELHVRIDQDLIAHIQARTTVRGEQRTAEIVDLDFGLGVGPPEGSSPDSGDPTGSGSTGSDDDNPRLPEGSVRLRPNVTSSRSAWDLVPGEIYDDREGALHGHRISALQQDERSYYQRCAVCGRSIYQINTEGCGEMIAGRPCSASRAGASASMPTP